MKVSSSFLQPSELISQVSGCFARAGPLADLPGQRVMGWLSGIGPGGLNQYDTSLWAAGTREPHWATQRGLHKGGMFHLLLVLGGLCFDSFAPFLFRFHYQGFVNVIGFFRWYLLSQLVPLGQSMERVGLEHSFDAALYVD